MASWDPLTGGAAGAHSVPRVVDRARGPAHVAHPWRLAHTTADTQEYWVWVAAGSQQAISDNGPASAAPQETSQPPRPAAPPTSAPPSATAGARAATGLGGGPLRTGAGLFDEGPVLQTNAPLAARPAPAPAQPRPAPPAQPNLFPAAPFPEVRADPVHAPSAGTRGPPPPGHPPSGAQGGFTPAPPSQRPPPQGAAQVQHPLAMPPPFSHPLAAPHAGIQAPGTPAQRGQTQQQQESPATPAIARPLAPPPSPHMPQALALPQADPEQMMMEFLGREGETVEKRVVCRAACCAG